VKRHKLLMVVATAAALALALGTSGVAGASGNGPTGSNDQVDRVVQAGSDTTYPAMTLIGDLYNGSPGCALNAGANDFFTSCVATDPAGTVTTENYDHDMVNQWYPVGSSAGVRQISKQGQAGVPQVDMARSSRDKQASDAKGMRFTAFAKDGITPIDWRTLASNGSQGGPAGGCKLGEATGTCTGTSVSNLATAQLVDIFVNCNIRDWRQLNTPGFTISSTVGAPVDPKDYQYNAAGNLPIYTWFIQSSSGTGLTWQNFLTGIGGSSPGVCPSNNAGDVALQTAYDTTAERTLFENNAQPIPTTNDVNGRNIRSLSIWAVSFGRWLTALNERAGSSLVRVNSIQAGPGTIGNSSYPITRFLWNVTPTTTADQGAPPPGDAVPSGTPPLSANRSGATTAFLNWICASSGGHGANPFNSRNYFDEITSAVSASGFVRGTGTQASPPGNGICYNQYTANT
jgi:ABC-type phosphate transport system substrate-binding protein